MAINKDPLFGGLPDTLIINVGTAKTAIAAVADPSADAGLFKVFEATTNGGFIVALEYQAISTGTPGATILNIWTTDAAGANAQVYKQIAIAANTAAVSTTVPGVSGTILLPYLNIQDGVCVYVSITVLAANTTYNVQCWGGQFISQ